MKYLFANWKMYLKEKDAVALAKVLRGVKTGKSVTAVALPSTLHVPAVAKSLGKVPFGVQDVGAVEYGAATGDTSAVEAKRMGAKYCLVGHSERRKAGESDTLVGKKFAAALRAGLVPVLCVGESEEERKVGKAVDVVLEQIEAALREAGNLLATKKFLVAYEPVRAIGTGVACLPKNVLDMHTIIRKQLAMLVGEKGVAAPILYGGSVSAENMAEYLALPVVDGVLVGGASTKAKELMLLLGIICS
jgi:triosephosphate isomerase